MTTIREKGPAQWHAQIRHKGWPPRKCLKIAAEPKELVVIPGANRIDLYDRTEIIPWAKLNSFFDEHLNDAA